jgi:transposase
MLVGDSDAGGVTRGAEIFDAVWARIQPLMPNSDGLRGPPFREHRQVMEGIAFRYRTGVAWRDLPQRFGPWHTVWKRHHRFCSDGTWDRLLAVLQPEADQVGELDWKLSVDFSVVRAHRHGASAKRMREDVATAPASHRGRVELRKGALLPG